MTPVGKGSTLVLKSTSDTSPKTGTAGTYILLFLKNQHSYYIIPEHVTTTIDNAR